MEQLSQIIAGSRDLSADVELSGEHNPVFDNEAASQAQTLLRGSEVTHTSLHRSFKNRLNVTSKVSPGAANPSAYVPPPRPDSKGKEEGRGNARRSGMFPRVPILPPPSSQRRSSGSQPGARPPGPAPGPAPSPRPDAAPRTTKPREVWRRREEEEEEDYCDALSIAATTGTTECAAKQLENADNDYDDVTFGSSADFDGKPQQAEPSLYAGHEHQDLYSHLSSATSPPLPPKGMPASSKRHHDYINMLPLEASSSSTPPPLPQRSNRSPPLTSSTSPTLTPSPPTIPHKAVAKARNTPSPNPLDNDYEDICSDSPTPSHTPTPAGRRPDDSDYDEVASDTEEATPLPVRASSSAQQHPRPKPPVKPYSPHEAERRFGGRGSIQPVRENPPSLAWQAKQQRSPPSKGENPPIRKLGVITDSMELNPGTEEIYQSTEEVKGQQQRGHKSSDGGKGMVKPAKPPRRGKKAQAEQGQPDAAKQLPRAMRPGDTLKVSRGGVGVASYSRCHALCCQDYSGVMRNFRVFPVKLPTGVVHMELVRAESVAVVACVSWLRPLPPALRST